MSRLPTLVRIFLQKYYMAEIRPLLDQYWMNVFYMRTENDCWPIDAPLVDVFKPIQIVDKKTGEKTLNCVIPIEDARPFWDVILAFYPLFKPDMWPDEGRVARQILDRLPKLLEPINLSLEVVKYLQQVAEGQQCVMFYRHPIEFKCTIKVFFLMAANWPASEDEETWKSFEEQIEKWKDQAIEDEEKNHHHWEIEWKKILKNIDTEENEEVWSRACTDFERVTLKE